MRRVVPPALAVAVLWLGLLFAPRAWAVSGRRLVVLEARARPLPGALLDALRIQLVGIATVTEVALPVPSVSLETAQRACSELTTVLWLDESHVEPVLTVLAAGNGAQPVRLTPAWSDSPESARVLALKLSLIVDQPESRSEAVTARATTRAFGELRAAASDGGAPRLWLPSIGLAAGPRWERAHWIFEAHGSFALRAGLQSRSAVGETDVSFTYLGVGGRALLRSERMAAGPTFELGMETLRAHGVTKDKRRGAAELTAPVASLGLQTRWLASQNFELCANGSAELWLIRERLELLGTPTVDLGRIRANVGISGIFVFP